MESITQQEALVDWTDEWTCIIWAKFIAEHIPNIHATDFHFRDLEKIKKTNVGKVLYELWDEYLWDAEYDRNHE